tara:strand:- start:7987 stop:9228 length:1242 start_codon:yes stop_codon:yes gene_type:complete
MPVNNLRIGWLVALAVVGCAVLSFSGRAVGDELSKMGRWVTYPVVGQGAATSVLGLSEPAQVFGLAMARRRFSGLTFAGQGSHLSVLSGHYAGVDSRLFHPSGDRPVDYQGGAIRYSVALAYVDLGGVRITSSGVGDRHSWYGGISTDVFSSSLFRIEREDGVAAYAADICAKMRDTTLTVRQIEARSAYDRQVNLTLPFTFRIYPQAKLELEFHQGRSQRFSGSNSERLMLTLRGRFGRSPQLALAAGQERGLGDGVRDVAVLGATAVAVALIASSGDADTDSISRWSRQHDAAWNVLNDINPTSVSENVEYGSWVYRNADATFSALSPVRGTVNSVNIGSPNQVPSGTVATASYHTHGGDDPLYDSENFSPTDLITDNLWKVDGYLGTPSGAFKFHNYVSGEVSRLGTIAN